MNFLSRLLRLLFWIVVISWSMRLLRRAIAWMLGDPAQAPAQGAENMRSAEIPGIPQRLVRDPVCGTHVAEGVSIPLQQGDKVLRFCSAACRDVYAGSTRQMAANG